MISPEAKRITNKIYDLYGSGSGYLFGIPPKDEDVVKTIVQATIEIINEGEK